MPIEVVLLQDRPEPFYRCPECRGQFRSFMRGQVQSWWRRLLRRPYCTVICAECKQIVGHEKP